MATVQNTLELIRSHGHFATATADGVLALSWEGRTPYADLADSDDAWCEAPAVFPIIDGNVSTSAVRAWLGY